jgi:hypothetical protein
MIELKREVNELCEKLGQAPRHRIPGDGNGLVASTVEHDELSEG